MTKNLQLTKDLSLLDLEDLSRSLAVRGDEPLQIWLPDEIGAQFFKDTRIASLLAHAHQSGGFTLVDWVQESSPERNERRYGTQLLGLVGLMCSREVRTAKKQQLVLNQAELISSIIERDAIIERPEERGTSLTFCAFDEEIGADMPIPFVGAREKADFVSILIKYRKKYLEQGIALGYSDRQSQIELRFDSSDPATLSENQDKVLAGFVYELLLNAYQHGCLDAEGRVIPGVRFVRLRKHIGTNQRGLLDQASGVSELQEYLQRVTPHRGTVGFYEIAVGDRGMGLLERFLTTRPELAPCGNALPERVALVNRIIVEALSSKRTSSGAGHGLRKAINAVRQLRGFVSLRTNDVWLYWAYTGAPDAPDSVLKPFSHGCDLPSTAGTTYNMLFPIQ